MLQAEGVKYPPSPSASDRPYFGGFLRYDEVYFYLFFFLLLSVGLIGVILCGMKVNLEFFPFFLFDALIWYSTAGRFFPFIYHESLYIYTLSCFRLLTFFFLNTPLCSRPRILSATNKSLPFHIL